MMPSDSRNCNRFAPQNIAKAKLEDLLAILDNIETRRKVARVQVYHGLRERAYAELTEMKQDIDSLRDLVSAAWYLIEGLKE